MKNLFLFIIVIQMVSVIFIASRRVELENQNEYLTEQNHQLQGQIEVLSNIITATHKETIINE